MTQSQYRNILKFGRHYDKARSLFLKSAKSVGAGLSSYQHPLRGPDGQRLFVDIAWLGPKTADNVLVLMSGTHGAEGLCGSDVQTRLMSDPEFTKLPENSAIMCIHGVNPYGFSWVRRTTEEGVDLCRNFLDFSKPRPENPTYDELIDAIVPTKISGPVREKADMALGAQIQSEGPAAFGAKIAVGQYRYWQAPFFGGDAATWANRTIMRICDEWLSDRKDVAVIDYHTGLGENGVGEMLCFHANPGEDLKRARDWWGEAVTSVYSSDETVAYPLTGGILPGMERALPNVRFTAGAHEFGTKEPLAVLNAMRADHWLHAYGDFYGDNVEGIKADLLAAFYDDSDAWRERVWEQSVESIRSALKNLGA